MRHIKEWYIFLIAVDTIRKGGTLVMNMDLLFFGGEENGFEA